MLPGLSGCLQPQQLLGVLTGVRAAAGLQGTPGTVLREEGRARLLEGGLHSWLPGPLPPLSRAASSSSPTLRLPPRLRSAGAKGFQTTGPRPLGLNCINAQSRDGCPACPPRTIASCSHGLFFPSCSSLSSRPLSQGRGAHSRETGMCFLTFFLLPWSHWFCVSLSLPSGSEAPSYVPIQS